MNDDDAYHVVLTNAGVTPHRWPGAPGLTRSALAEGPIGVVDHLQEDYGLPKGTASGAARVRRNRLARHIGGFPV